MRKPPQRNRVVVKKNVPVLESGESSSSDSDGGSDDSEPPQVLPKSRKVRQLDNDSNSSLKKKEAELKSKQGKQSTPDKKKERTNLDLLLELDDCELNFYMLHSY